MLPGAHRQVRQRAGGRWVAHWYAWRGGPPIGHFWADSPGGLIDAENAAAVDLARAYVDERTQRPAVGLVARAVREYRQSPDFAALSASWKKINRKYLDEIAARFGKLSGEQFADDERAIKVREWRDELAVTSARGADHAMEVLSRLCSWARQRSVKLLPKDCNPTEGLKAVYVRPPQRAWSRTQVDVAMGKLPPRIGNVIALAVNTGLRRSDLCALTWSAIDEGNGVIRWAPQKGVRKRRVVVIELKPALRATLKRIKALQEREHAQRVASAERRKRPIPLPPAHVLTHTYGKAYRPDSLYQAVMRALAEIGAKDTLHGLRRASATQLARQGMSSRQIARILGWSESEAEQMSALYIDDEDALGANETSA